MAGRITATARVRYYDENQRLLMVAVILAMVAGFYRNCYPTLYDRGYAMGAGRNLTGYGV